MDAILPEFQEGDEPHEQFAFSPTLDPKTLLSKPISSIFQFVILVAGSYLLDLTQSLDNK